MNTTFLIELILHFWAFGFIWVFTRKKILWVEIVLSVMAIGAEIDFLVAKSYGEVQSGISVVCTVFLLRTFRLVILIQEVYEFDLIFTTFLRFSTPFLTMCLSLYAIFYTFANMGMLLFGGKVTLTSAQINYPSEIPALFYLMNFNDFPSAIITLFHIMVVNNWYVTANMYYYVCNERSWPIFYFTLFWVITVTIMLNLVISFVVDIYTDVSSDLQEEYKRRLNAINLKEKFED